MDIEEIKTLTDLMIENDLSEIMIRDGDKRIVLRRGAAGGHVRSQAPSVAPVVIAAPVAVDPAAAPAAAPAESPAAKQDNLVAIKSPMVGTFYASPDPDSPPFVQIGDELNPETVVCIIEAMKVFNEIKAEATGIVESIEVENGQAVEFGQIIMKVRPA
ncbi:MAG TPA: acetyl-CoA carboxylase biotin carboxyl carrier protein [Phycisphaerae bacterium]|nr:acetyl-CoA carboxylase biotin carboxyl carrier protein [Phycisphaerae bacterium]